jgi:hypothetical protein
MLYNSTKTTGFKSNRFSLVALTLSLGITCLSSLPAQAINQNDIIQAIDKAKILASGTRVAAAVSGSDVYISTYKHLKANDNDCKIEAVLMSKTAMDLAPQEIARATIYFYSSFNLNKRKVVAVTAGDVKAFGSGQLSQDQLMASLGIKDEEVNDPASRLSTYLQQREGARTRKKIESYMSGDTLEVVADLDSDMTERDMKYEALKIAEKAVETSAGSARKIKVSFADPIAKGSFKQILFDMGQLRNLDSSLQSALMGIQVAAVNAKIDVQALVAGDGSYKDEREKLLTRLKNLDKGGVGITPFLKQFFDIEQMVSVGNEEQADATIAKLDSNLSEQEARTKTAKEPKPVKAAVPKVKIPEVQGRKSNRWSTGVTQVTDEDILTDPDKAAQRVEDALGGRSVAEGDRRFLEHLERISILLDGKGRSPEAQKFAQRAASIKGRIRQ